MRAHFIGPPQQHGLWSSQPPVQLPKPQAGGRPHRATSCSDTLLRRPAKRNTRARRTPSAILGAPVVPQRHHGPVREPDHSLRAGLHQAPVLDTTGIDGSYDVTLNWSTLRVARGIPDLRWPHHRPREQCSFRRCPGPTIQAARHHPRRCHLQTTGTQAQAGEAPHPHARHRPHRGDAHAELEIQDNLSALIDGEREGG